MVKFRYYLDTDKETKWLNRMAEQGWAVTGVFFGGYRFAKCEPGEYIYQVDIVEGMFSVSEDYRQFMEEMGVEIVCLWGSWVLLRRRAEEGPFDMYTDAESTYEHYGKIQKMFQTVAVIDGVSLFYGIISAVSLKRAANWAAALMTAVILLIFLGAIRRLNGILAGLRSRLEREVAPESGGASSALVRGICVGGIYIGLFCVMGLLHELGHCIAVWICGGTVIGFHPFDPVRPHMVYEGVTDSLSIALVHAAGSVLPLMAAAAVLLFYRGSKKHSLLNVFLEIMSGYCILTVIAWIVAPLCYLLNFGDPSDDMFKFIRVTGFHPIAVALCATVIFALMTLLFVRRAPDIFGDFGKAVGRKFIVLIISVTVVIYVLSVFAVTDKITITAEGNFQYTVESSRVPLLQEEFSIDITQPGDYVIYAEWEVDRDGVIAGVVLKDENEVYFSCTGAVWLTVESLPFHLDSGSYTLSFYLLSCEEDWLEYCRIAGVEESDIVDFPYQPDDLPDVPATVTGSYRLTPKR